MTTVSEGRDLWFERWKPVFCQKRYGILYDWSPERMYKPVLKLDFTPCGITETLTEFRPSSRDINNIRQQLQKAWNAFYCTAEIPKNYTIGKIATIMCSPHSHYLSNVTNVLTRGGKEMSSFWADHWPTTSTKGRKTQIVQRERPFIGLCLAVWLYSSQALMI